MGIINPKFRENYKTIGWAKKITREIGNVIVKEFHSSGAMPSIEEEKHNLHIAQKHLWNYIPKTKLVWEDHWYKIIQEKIEWEILWALNAEELSIETMRQLSDLMDKYHEYCEETGQYFDPTGRSIFDCGNVYLDWLYALIFGKSFRWSTNIIIENTTQKPYLVDVVAGPVGYNTTWKSKLYFSIMRHTKTCIYKHYKNKLERQLQKISTNNEDII